jgi:hypothetical protein
MKIRVFAAAIFAALSLLAPISSKVRAAQITWQLQLGTPDIPCFLVGASCVGVGQLNGSTWTLPLAELPQVSPLTVLGNALSTTGNVTTPWTVPNATDTIIPLMHGLLTSGHLACLNDALGTLKDCGTTLPSGLTIPSASLTGQTTLNYSGGLPLSSTFGGIPLNSAIIVNGTTTSTNQNFLLFLDTVSNTVSNQGAVTLQYVTEGTANSGSVFGMAGGLQLDPGFNTSLFSGFAHEFDINNLAGDYGDIGASASLSTSCNGLGFRNSACLYINNSETTLSTSTASASGTNVLHFASIPPWVKVGALVQDTATSSAIPANTTISAVTSTTVTLSANLTGSGVGSGDSIILSQPLFFEGIKIAPFAASMFGFRDVSNSMTAFEAEGTHNFGLDLSGATTLGVGVRLGTGAASGIGFLHSGSTFAALFEDASGQTNIGTGTTGQIIVRGSMLPSTTNTFSLGDPPQSWFQVVAQFHAGGGPAPTFASGTGTLSTGADATQGTVTETGTTTGYSITLATRSNAPDCVVTSHSGVSGLTYSTTPTTLTVTHASAAAAVTSYVCMGI